MELLGQAPPFGDVLDGGDRQRGPLVVESPHDRYRHVDVADTAVGAYEAPLTDVAIELTPEQTAKVGGGGGGVVGVPERRAQRSRPSRPGPNGSRPRRPAPAQPRRPTPRTTAL